MSVKFRSCFFRKSLIPNYYVQLKKHDKIGQQEGWKRWSSILFINCLHKQFMNNYFLFQYHPPQYTNQRHGYLIYPPNLWIPFMKSESFNVISVHFTFSEDSHSSPTSILDHICDVNEARVWQGSIGCRHWKDSFTVRILSQCLTKNCPQSEICDQREIWIIQDLAFWLVSTLCASDYWNCIYNFHCLIIEIWYAREFQTCEWPL